MQDDDDDDDDDDDEDEDDDDEEDSEMPDNYRQRFQVSQHHTSGGRPQPTPTQRK